LRTREHYTRKWQSSHQNRLSSKSRDRWFLREVPGISPGVSWPAVGARAHLARWNPLSAAVICKSKAGRNGTPIAAGTAIEVSNTALPPGASSSIDGIEWGGQSIPGGRNWYPNPIPLFARYRSSDGRWFRTVVADYRPGSSERQIFEEE
jgi:hypothetical protein